MGKKKAIILALSIAIVSIVFGYIYFFDNESSVSGPNYEATARVLEVRDGDTMVVDIESVRDPHKGISTGEDVVRLAKIDTEELSLANAEAKHKFVENLSEKEYKKTPYYSMAVMEKKCLKKHTKKGTKIYIDIDDLAKGNGPYYQPYRGDYNRIIATIYTKKNKNWINLNALLLKKYHPKHLYKTKYRSEFSIKHWLENDYPYL